MHEKSTLNLKDLISNIESIFTFIPIKKNKKITELKYFPEVFSYLLAEMKIMRVE